MTLNHFHFACSHRHDDGAAVAGAEPDPWDVFDAIFCITLNQRPDRTTLARHQFQTAGLLHRVEFIHVEKHPTDTEQGIFESHQHCLRIALERGAETILIFEDDVVLQLRSPEHLAAMARFVESQRTWRLFLLGAFIRRSKPSHWPRIRKVRYRCTTHGYAVRAELARELAQLPWQGEAYDDVLRRRDEPETYMIYPALAYQGDSRSDNEKLQTLNRVRNMLGGMARLQRLTEWTNRWWDTLVITHLGALLLLIGFALWRLTN